MRAHPVVTQAHKIAFDNVPLIPSGKKNANPDWIGVLLWR